MTSQKPVRGVTIELMHDSWMVVYSNRKKGGRYCAAQFYAKDHSHASVVEWVNSNPKLKLIL